MCTVAHVRLGDGHFGAKTRRARWDRAFHRIEGGLYTSMERFPPHNGEFTGAIHPVDVSASETRSCNRHADQEVRSLTTATGSIRSGNETIGQSVRVGKEALILDVTQVSVPTMALQSESYFVEPS